MRARNWLLAGGVLCMSGAACSSILGLDPPPSEDGGATGTPDATSGDGATASEAGIDAGGDTGGDTGGDAGTPGDGAVTPTACTPLDGGAGGETYFPLPPTAVDGSGDLNWAFFGVGSLPGFGTSGFGGGTFDGRYVYFAGNAGKVARYDTTQAFDAAAAWSNYAAATASGFGGAVFDGRYVYFVPYMRSGASASIAARYDTFGSFEAADAWATFDLSALASDGGAATSGFYGAVFDGRDVFFVPRNDGTFDGRALRYDPSESLDAAAPADGGPPAIDAGDAGDGGEAGAAAPGSFGDPTLWTSFDVSSVNSQARGFAGGVSGGGALYLVPNYNDAFDGSVHGGNSSIVARHLFSGQFTAASMWSTFDTTLVNGIASGYVGGAFDGQYVYFAPRVNGVVTRFDTSVSALTTLSGWSAYDTTRLGTLEGGAPQPYAGAAFDGRFVYFVPTTTSGAMLTRYDTLSTFTADCAWSAFDPTQLAAGDAGALDPFVGAVFDGQYLYLIPNGGPNPIFARFTAKTPAALPSLPNFHGSFL
jgi:hypothetical protein